MQDCLFCKIAAGEIPSKKVKAFDVTLDYAREQLEKAHFEKLESA